MAASANAPQPTPRLAEMFEGVDDVEGFEDSELDFAFSKTFVSTNAGQVDERGTTISSSSWVRGNFFCVAIREDMLPEDDEELRVYFTWDSGQCVAGVIPLDLDHPESTHEVLRQPPWRHSFLRLLRNGKMSAKGFPETMLKS